MTALEIIEKNSNDVEFAGKIKQCTCPEDGYAVLAKDYGYTGSVEELKEEMSTYLKEMRVDGDEELDDDMLEDVTGGADWSTYTMYAMMIL